eukprot:2396520-Pyramimonas_sp.AAC.1
MCIRDSTCSFGAPHLHPSLVVAKGLASLDAFVPSSPWPSAPPRDVSQFPASAVGLAAALLVQATLARPVDSDT